MAKVTTLKRNEDCWVLPLTGCEVQQLVIDYEFKMLIDGAEPYFLVAIGGTFSLEKPNGDRVADLEADRDPTALAPALSLLHRTVDYAKASDDGRLEMRFDDGHIIRVATSDGYEAWDFVGPRGARLVSIPGGSLAVWSGDDRP